MFSRAHVCVSERASKANDMDNVVKCLRSNVSVCVCVFACEASDTNNNKLQLDMYLATKCSPSRLTDIDVGPRPTKKLKN